MTCDFNQYKQLREATAAAATNAEEKCNTLEQKEQELIAAQQARDAAHQDKITSYDAWQSAEQAENAAAAELGINPIPPGA